VLSVVVLQRLVTGLLDLDAATAITVASTLLIAVLFAPLRRAIQARVDRRFFRRRYDAAKTLAGFAATARDQVELDRLTAGLVEVVQETMEPESLSLWLAPDGRKGKDRGGGLIPLPARAPAPGSPGERP
jgi:hypothetical protein